MSKVKTRKEINEELTALNSSIAEMKSDHAAKVAALESTVSILTEELDQAKAAITEADALAASKTEEIGALTASLESVKAELTAEREVRAETEAGLEKAKAALANPAFVDASIIPHQVNQKLEDAEADEAEAKAQKQSEADKPDLNALDTYESMPQGEDRREYYAKNKNEIHRLMNEREI